MKIVVTITDAAGVVHAGATIESRSAILEIPNDKLPTIVKQYLENKVWAKQKEGRYTYEYMTFSILDEEAECEK